MHTGAIPQLVMRPIGLEPFSLLSAEITPVRLLHGATVPVLGFRVGNVAYCTDVNAIPAESMDRLRGLDVLVLDCLRHEPHVTHFGLEQSLAVAKELQPRRTLLTHMSHKLEHEATNAVLPPGVELAYDGLELPLT
jgi:phosphoribosyl 1,2-cyclic phosphate phosphodiesterase